MDAPDQVTRLANCGDIERFASTRHAFTRDQFRDELFEDKPRNTSDASLRHHVERGRFKHVAFGVYATVPRHLNPRTYQPDRYAVASLVRADGILAFGSALDIHGLAYSETNQIHVLSGGRPSRKDRRFVIRG